MIHVTQSRRSPLCRRSRKLEKAKTVQTTAKTKLPRLAGLIKTYKEISRENSHFNTNSLYKEPHCVVFSALKSIPRQDEERGYEIQ